MKKLLLAVLLATFASSAYAYTGNVCQQDTDADTVGSGYVSVLINMNCQSGFTLVRSCFYSYSSGLACASTGEADNCPLAANADQLDTDGDGAGDICDNASYDNDSDGLNNAIDNCPVISNVDQLNTDGDSQGNACDSDDDNDGAADTSDACPLDSTASTDNTDGDSLCNLNDTDDDNDAIDDVSDNCPLIVNNDQLDTDSDSQGNACDSDDDNDGVADASDDLPLDASESVDTDHDGIGNNIDTDDDGDTVFDVSDNCPLQANANQADVDGDSLGDVCDNDADADGVANASDEWPLDSRYVVDTDRDTLPDNWETAHDRDPNVADYAINVGCQKDELGGICTPLASLLGKIYPVYVSLACGNPSTLNRKNYEYTPAFGGVTVITRMSTYTESGSVCTGPFLAITNSVFIAADGLVQFYSATNDRFCFIDRQGKHCYFYDGTALSPESSAAMVFDSDHDDVQRPTDPDDLDDLNPWIDTDSDSIHNLRDIDDDNDGAPDVSDAFPLDATESIDTDGDGIGNNADNDADNDSVEDASDAFPLDATESVDTDGDGIGDNADTTPNGDTDGDGIDNLVDNCAAVANADQLNTDGDAEGDACDNDDDNDGVVDGSDEWPLDSRYSIDVDRDTLPDNWEVDQGRNPAIADYAINTNCQKDELGGICVPATTLAPTYYYALPPPLSRSCYGANEPGRADRKFTPSSGGIIITTVVNKCYGGIYSETYYGAIAADHLVQFYGLATSFCYLDRKGKHCYASLGVSPIESTMVIDSDHDGVQRPDDADDLDSLNPVVDADSDGADNNIDNCVLISNPDQLNSDNDAQGDACDADDDNDSVEDVSDAFPLDATESVDTDGDGVGDNADSTPNGDTDNDGVDNLSDNCPLISNIDQLNTDGDTQGDACDSTPNGDTDNDGVDNLSDNCPAVSNADQLDSDSDTEGDVCDVAPFVADAGSLDSSFNLDVNGSVNAIVVQSDGKIIIGGAFTMVNGVTLNRIARLNMDGTLDSAFAPGLGVDGTTILAVKTISMQKDGKIIIAGRFNSFNGVARNHVARLNADGSLDASFDPGTGAGNVYASIYTSAVQADGKVVIAGGFSSVNGIARRDIARLNVDGSVDSGFNYVSSAYDEDAINKIAIQDDGKIIIARWFNDYDRAKINRLNPDGTLDSSFLLNGRDIGDFAPGFVLQSDGKIIIDDNESYDPVLRRANTDGTFDTGFNPSGEFFDGRIAANAVQADGKIIFGDDNMRLNADGSLDSSYRTILPKYGVSATTLQADGKILIGGSFTRLGEHQKMYIARLHSGDSDGDAIEDGADNCTDVSNVDQLNTDGDSEGNACDNDDDNDSVEDVSDAFPLDATESVDTDGDGVGDNADSTPNGDTDNDGVDNLSDNCVSVSNADQLNTDGDTQGDVCDTTPNGDSDGDGVDNNGDNCPTVSNTDQVDIDADGAGDVCDLFPLDDALLLEQNGTAKNENFASGIAMSDMNNDGVIDVLVGAPMANVVVDGKTLKKAGVIRIISGKDNSILRTLSSTATNQQFGTAIAVVGDQNSDNVPDIIVGEPLADITTTVLSKTKKLKDAGRVAVYSGSNGALLSVIAEGSKANDHFGAAVTASDVNNDAQVDLIVGAPNADTVAKNSGQVTVFNGLSSAVLYQRSGDQAGESFGAAIAAVDDQHLFVGSPLRDVAKLKDAGRVQIFNAANGDSIVLLTLEGAAKNNHLGAAVSAAHDEWAVGMPLADSAGKDAGSVQLFSGMNITPIATLHGKTTGDNFGSALNMQVDVNQDGKNDIAIGAAKFDVSTSVEKRKAAGIKTVLLKDAGRVEVLSGVALEDK